MASSASALPWLWVIEALAIVKQVDASVIKELAKRTPEITGDLGKDAREMVYFRVLDTLASQQVRSNGSVLPSAPVSENKIDPSEGCENVVRRLLHERTGKAEILKSEVQDFITRKRASLPKCTLQKLKDTILEGKHPALAYLKEKSGLSTSVKTRERTATGYVVSSGVVGLSDGRTVVGGDLFSSNAENLDDLSQKDCGNKNLTPSKRDTSYLESENEDFRSHTDSLNLDNASDAHLQITKKLKRDASVSGLLVGHEPLPAVREEQPVALVDELELDLSDKARDDGCCCAENGTSNAATSNGAYENIHSNPNPNMEKSQQRQFDDVPHNKFHSNNFPREGQHDMDHNPVRECFSDSDGYHEERLDIARKRCNFLSSQCTFTQDSLAIDDCTELNFCMKCEKGGELLVCSATACPIVVHQSCLGTAPSFDNSGKFFCPFCSYSRAISEYIKIKKKASLIRKDLAVFIGLENGHKLKQVSKKSIRPESNIRRQDDNVNKTDQNHQNHVNDAINSENRENIGDMQEAEPSTSNANPPLRGEGALADDGPVISSIANNRESGKMGSLCQPAMALERQKIENGHRLKQIAKKSIRPEPYWQRQFDIVKRNHHKHENCVSHAINSEDRENIGDLQQVETSTSYVDPPLRKEGAVVDDGMIFASNKSNRDGGKQGPECRPAMALERQQIEAHDSQNQGNNSSPCGEREMDPMTEKHAFEHGHHDPNMDVATSSKEKYEQPASDYIMRHRKQEMQYTYPATPQLRRKKLQWTYEEEEILKEGVKKFTGDHHRVMKWKEILEFGSQVFQKGRTAVDLKDKWRNVCKRR